MMSRLSIVLVRTVLILCLSAHVLITTQANLNKEDESAESTENHLTTLTCKTAVQCSGGKKTTTGCVLADVDAVNLYRTTLRYLLQKHLISNFDVVEEIKIESTPESDKVESFLMVPQSGHRYVYKAWMTSNRTEKTGIFVPGEVSDMVYDRTSNTLFFSGQGGIFKQVVAAKSKKIRILRLDWFADLNIYKGTLFFRSVMCVKSISLTKGGSMRTWHRKASYFVHFVIDGSIACWRMVTEKTIECIDISSKKVIFLLKCVHFRHLTLVKASYFGTKMLLFVDFDLKGLFHAKMVEITAEGRFKKPKQICSFPKRRDVYLVPGFLLYNFYKPGKVEIWEMKHGDSIGDRKLSVYYPFVATPIKVAFM